ncbi:cysteine hydrolase family protein [Herpetosiphon llansteffanensis]|uniref:cysteine hydrolase family protein n=1 Tax=Herpetosiphon llansteffanensis TaxID=2094568 RepID=UPI000D7D0D71|nr:cysteine hydrolase family protein [Herpetosiphon llansteffanensis]
MTQTALVLLDVQVNLFAPEATVHASERVLAAIETLINAARANNAAVVYVQHNGGPDDPDAPGSPGWQLHEVCTLQAGDLVLQKETPNAFLHTDLAEMLRQREIKQLVLAGFQTELCIDTTCRAAWSRGFRVSLAADAHSTFDGETLKAAQIIAHHNSVLRNFARVYSSYNIKF